ncbi:uncharacterized protein LOC116003991 [Ipomoea triloba]|uniref:uncharacterized protein LOC116003991 n=1 Tax=Ipomoea triloba TaxID=35885 RepID=UPI00125D9632|nr:uncharacterized protein LOC116003991 [Ipomoea triloba]
MSDLRPIALCNVLYKILAKALANRIKPLLNSLISNSQSVFVPNRLITDNLLLAYESHHYLNRKTQGNTGYVSMKIDMSKAYDRYKVSLEGKELGPIVPRRGLRQGDPLSPYLFILVMEGLSAMISMEIKNNGIHGIKVARGAPEVSHLFFADDYLLFCRANSFEANVMKATLAEFSLASRQHINYNKSSLMFSKNVDSLTREVVCEVMGISEGSHSGRYLGLPSLVGRSKNQILGFIRQKVISRIKSWNNNFLLKAGREVLIKNVLHAIPTFAMSIFLLPVETCNGIELAMNKFWWKGDVDSNRGINWKKWQDLCKPKSFGGMGFRKIREFNIALLGKQAWRFIQFPDSLVSRVFKAKYFNNTSFLEAKLGSNSSFVWRSIMEAQPIMKANCRWRVGDGHSINIWKDPWIPRKDNPFVKTAMPHYLEHAKVNSLMEMNQEKGAEAIIKDIFVEEDWDHIMKCAFAKSCWSKIPSIPQRAGGLFLDWFNDCVSRLKSDSLALMATVCWKVWDARNKLVWQNQRSHPSHIVDEAVVFLDAWRTIHNTNGEENVTTTVHTWKRPHFGKLKLNVDAAFDATKKRTGLGCILRDEEGKFIAALQQSCDNLYQPKIGEAIAIREALKWIKALNFQSFIVESDAQLVILGLKASSCMSSFDLILQDIRNLASDVYDISFSFAKRSANKAAHMLAREALFFADRRE